MLSTKTANIILVQMLGISHLIDDQLKGMARRRWNSHLLLLYNISCSNSFSWLFFNDDCNLLYLNIPILVLHIFFV